MARLDLKVPPVVVTFITASGMYSIARIDPLLLGGGAAAVSRLLGFVLLIVGGVAAGAGVRAFAKASTTVDPRAPQRVSVLVVNGVYRFTRNPMYLGFLVMLLGSAALLSSPLAAALSSVFVAYLNRFQIAPEERWLADRFGPAFADYCRRVRRWL